MVSIPGSFSPLALSALALGVFALPTLHAVDVVVGEITYDVGDSTVTVKDCSTAATSDLIVESEVLEKPVVAVGDEAFAECGQITGVTLPSGVLSIGENAFKRCRKLTNISLPAGLLSIEKSGFEQCDSLTTVVLPASVGSLGDEVFYSCDDLTSVNIPAGVPIIGDYAFADCVELESLTLPEGVTTLGEEAFSACYKLPSINIPASVNSIGAGAFYDCELMESIDVDPLNPIFASVDGVLFSKDLTTLLRVPCGRPGPSYTIPFGTQHLAFYSFEYCVNLSGIIIPNSVQTIDELAFYYTRQITTIDIPDSVTSLGDRAFLSCNGLTSITIGSGLATLGDEVFQGCDDLMEIQVDPLNVNFADVDGVLFTNDLATLVRYPAARIGPYAIAEGTVALAIGAFDDCEFMTSVKLPNSLTTIGISAFDNCESLTRVTIPAGVSSIGTYAFTGCEKLICVQFLGNAPASVGNFAFPTQYLEFEFKARVGATGFDAGYFLPFDVGFVMSVVSQGFDGSGNFIITTDALNSNGLTVMSSTSLSGFTAVTGVTDVGADGFMIPAGNDALASGKSFFIIDYDAGE